MNDLMPDDLLAALALIYKPGGFTCNNFFKEKESKEYSACSFELNDQAVRFRVAKITPTKTGQFVTLWKRDAQGITQPYNDTDKIDLFIVSVRKGDRVGQFVFPKSALCQKNIISTTGKEGKRGTRVYPPWDETTNRQAQKIQAWQLEFFIELNETALSSGRARVLYGQPLCKA